jgi:hypothetical protein
MNLRERLIAIGSGSCAVILWLLWPSSGDLTFASYVGALIASAFAALIVWALVQSVRAGE